MVAIIFLTGLAVGSFLNCLIYRLAEKTSPLRGRSFCPHCKHTLSWRDLIPVLSFLFLRGKCRYCQKKISWQYPLIELSTALLFVLTYNFLPVPRTSPWVYFYYWAVISFLIIVFVFDLKHYIIPDKVIYPAILIVLVFRILNLFGNWKLEIGNLGTLINPLVAAIGGAMFFLTIVLVSRGKWMGFGDVKLAFFMGFFLGFPNILVALFLAFLIGAIIGVGLILAKKKILKSEVPFGPFLVTGTFIALFWGPEIIRWYLDLFTC